MNNAIDVPEDDFEYSDSVTEQHEKKLDELRAEVRRWEQIILSPSPQSDPEHPAWDKYEIVMYRYNRTANPR